jgi:transposase
MKMFIEPNDIYLHSGFVDFRKSINGLLVIIEYELELSPFNDALFIFCNKKQNKIKIVYWDRTGFALWYKVLQKNRFKWPTLNDLKHIRLSEQQLQWLLGGYDVIGHRTLNYTSTGL